MKGKIQESFISSKFAEISLEFGSSYSIAKQWELWTNYVYCICSAHLTHEAHETS